VLRGLRASLSAYERCLIPKRAGASLFSEGRAFSRDAPIPTHERYRLRKSGFLTFSQFFTRLLL
jgi:hypothetical protein